MEITRELLLLIGVMGIFLISLVALWTLLIRERSRVRELEERSEDISGLSQRLHKMEEDQEFIGQFIREFPQLAWELQSQRKLRQVPAVLLQVVMRVFQPAESMVLIRRRPTLAEPDRDRRLVVAAVAPSTCSVKPGMEIAVGKGPLGAVAKMQQVMTAEELMAVTVTDDGRGDRNLIAFRPDLAAPMVHRDELLGVIAIRSPRLRQTKGKEVMRLIGQMGGFTLHSLATYLSMKSAVDVDPLTGLFNKRVLSHRLEDLVLEAESSGNPFGVFLFDIDHFKNYNDANGHVAGDRLLQMLSRVARDNARTDDILGRFGGEEFLLIVPGAGQREIVSTAHHLRRAIEAFDFPFGNLQPLGRLTVSGGAACYPDNGKDATSLLREADAALYRAKRAGRNQVATAAAGVVPNGSA